MHSIRFKIAVLLILGAFFCVAKNKDGKTLFNEKDKVSEQLNAKLSAKHGHFELNGGQYEENFRYRFSNHNATIDFYENKIVFGLRKVTRAFNPEKLDEPIQFDYIVWQIDLNASTPVLPTTDLEASNISYFAQNGKRVQRFQTEGVIYKDIYPNTDLVFYKNDEGALKYDFKLHPGAKLSNIQLTYHNVENLRIDEGENLVYSTKWGDISEDKPYSYWNSSEEEVGIDYKLKDSTLTFVAPFDEVQEELTLDPIYVDWSSYFYGLGTTTTGFGGGYTWVYDLDIDADDHVYVAGITSDRFPNLTNSFDTSTNGFYDAFVCKMAPAGDSIVWFSYLGGSQYEYCFSIAVNDDQEPVVSGFTWSVDFPITDGAFDTIPNIQNSGFSNYYAGYVTKFSENGDSLLFSTYLGGTSSDLIQSMVMDDNGYIFLTGQTKSTDFPVTAGAYQTTYGGSGGSSWWNGGDAFLVKMHPSGSSIEFGTYLGGAGDDVAYEVALGPFGDIFLVGKTSSTSFPITYGSSVFNSTVSGVSDGFITKFNATATTIDYSKLMGGSAEDWFEGVYVNERDEAYIAGITRSSNFHTTAKAYQKTFAGGADAVVVKLNDKGQYPFYSTFLGGSGDELYYSGFIYNSNVRIAANVREEPIICGITRSTDFPVTNDALDDTNPSSGTGSFWNTSATIAKLDNTGSKLLYGTYYGGSGYEVPGANKLKRISCYTNILYGGFTASSDYPTTPGVYKETKSTASTGFFWTGFISKFRDTLYTDEIDLSLEDTLIECDEVYEILNAKNVGADILWSNGSTRQYEILRDTGLVWVQATYGCDTVRDSIYFIREYSPTVPILPEDSTYCDAFPSITLDAQNDTIVASYLWDNGDTTQTIDINSPGEYSVSISTPNCGTKTDVVTYKLLRTPNPTFPRDSTFCDSTLIILDATTAIDNEEIYRWATGDSLATYTALDTGYYKVVSENYCGIDSAEFFAYQLATPELSLPIDSQFCDAIDLTLRYGKANNAENYSFKNLVTNNIIFVIPDTFRLTDVGRYEITSRNVCKEVKDTIELSLITSPVADLGADTVLCDDVNLTLEVGKQNNNEQYTWSEAETSNTYIATREGKYWVTLENKCAVSSDTILITKVISPEVNLPGDSIFCDNISIELVADNEEECDYAWSDGSSDSGLTVFSVGFYKVTVSNYCGAVSDSITIGMITSPEVDLGDDEIFCGGVMPITYDVGKEDNEETYLWSNGDASATSSLNKEGIHWVQISNKCNTSADTIEFIVSPNPVVSLGPDTTLCGDFSVTLDAGNAGMRYLWLPTGETTQTIEAKLQTIYTVTVYNENDCEGSDDFEIRPDCVSKSFIPNAFTPNGDGLNDVFKPTLINFEQYSLQIYNRWGERIFESSDVNVGWDGTYKGVQVPNGMYTYLMRYLTTENMQWQNVGGELNVVR